MLTAVLTCTPLCGTSVSAEGIAENTGLTTAVGIAANLVTALLQNVAETQKNVVIQDEEDAAEIPVEKMRSHTATAGQRA